MASETPAQNVRNRREGLIDCLVDLTIPVRFRHVTKSTASLRLWFSQNITKKKAEVAEMLEDADGDVSDEALKRDIFTRLTLASQVDSELHLDDSEIVSRGLTLGF